MKHIFSRCLVVFTVVVTLFALCTAVSAGGNTDVTVLFTHDLHSHLLPSADENGGEFGGYARLMTVIRRQKEKHRAYNCCRFFFGAGSVHRHASRVFLWTLA